MSDNKDILERLYTVIESRKGADADSSYTASLFTKGLDEISRKVGEEAIETITAALGGKPNENVTAESADLLYHLLVLWAECGIAPDQVWDELARREGTSGIEEKAKRS